MSNRFQQLLENSSQPILMGILNVTPDSFSDGGCYIEPEQALDHALQMIAEGAQIIDIGGESTRPGAKYVNIEEELKRVIPVISAIRAVNQKVVLSIDSSKAEVMQQAVACGADLINDVNALQSPGALQMAAKLQVPICLMHKLGRPATMQNNPVYENVVNEVLAFLRQRVEACERAGIARNQICIDPGFGFGKTLEHNLCLLKNLEFFKSLGLPLLVGFSKKTMFGKMLDLETEQRLIPSVAAAMIAVMKGATIFRVHDVKEHFQALKVYELMNKAPAQ